MTYGNGHYTDYTYNNLNQLKEEKTYTGGTLTRDVKYSYTGNGALAKSEDVLNGINSFGSYDALGRQIAESTLSTDGSLRLSASLEYDSAGRISKSSYIGANGLSKSSSYTYSTATGLLNTVSFGNHTNSYLYDGLQRLQQIQHKNGSSEIFTENYAYESSGDDASALVSSVSVKKGNTNIASFGYTYDSMGRIASHNGFQYAYDELGELTEVKNAAGQVIESYTYDHVGNILSKNINGNTVSYVYETGTPWRDLLKRYNGQNITYDTIGNPLSYRGWTFTWKNGRELSSAANAGNTISYTYDADGMRLSKTVNGVLHSYIYSGSKVLSEKYGNTILNFSYDEQGRPESVQYSTDNGASFATYYYVCNLQGDVIKILNSSGSSVCEYSYSAFGTVTAVTGSGASGIGTINPLRFKGYYFDSETGFYYLCSRYYDPETCRFINADDATLIGADGDALSYNLFTYCGNNPVNDEDPTGELPKWLTGVWNVASGTFQTIVGAALGATIGWTGVGAVVAGFLVINGAAMVAQGIGQIINDVTKSSVMREDNVVKTGVEAVGNAIGGKKGEKIASVVYDATVVAADIYAGKVCIEASLSKIVNSKLFEINNGYGIKIGQTAKKSYGYVNLLYQNPSFLKKYGVRGGTFISINNALGDCLFRIDWDPEKGLHIQ